MIRKFSRLALALFLVMALALPAWAAIAVEGGYGYITVTLDGSNDFNWSTATITTGVGSGAALTTLFPKGLQINTIDVFGSAAGAKTIIRDGSLTGQKIPPVVWYTVDGSPQVQYYLGRWYQPCIKHSDQTSDNGTIVTFSYNN